MSTVAINAAVCSAHDLGQRTLLIDAEGREIGRVQGISEWDSPDVVAYLRQCLKP